jgi:hypothetical protein
MSVIRSVLSTSLRSIVSPVFFGILTDNIYIGTREDGKYLVDNVLSSKAFEVELTFAPMPFILRGAHIH